MTNNKEKYAFWLTPEAKKMIEINAPLANCGIQSKFVEKAVRFYNDYLKVQNAGAFLPHAVADVLKGRFFRVRWTHPALGAVGIFAQGEPDSDRDIWAGEPGQISINWEML